MSPMMATPWVDRSKRRADAMPATSTTSPPGSLGSEAVEQEQHGERADADRERGEAACRQGS